MQATLLQEFKDNLASSSGHLQAMFNIVKVGSDVPDDVPDACCLQ
jgi:hypothetical protein